MAFNEGHFRTYHREIASGNTPAGTLCPAAVAVFDTTVCIVIDTSDDAGTTCGSVVSDFSLVIRIFNRGMAPAKEASDNPTHFIRRIYPPGVETFVDESVGIIRFRTVYTTGNTACTTGSGDLR